MRTESDGSYDDLVDPSAASERVFVSFGLHPRQNEQASLEAGRPIYDDVEYVQIIVPGDKNNVVHRPVQEADKRRFAAQYRAWRSGQHEAQSSGTPLSAWPGVTRAQVEELAYFHVRTVEQLAELSDGNAQNIGPVLQLRQRARDFIAAARGAAPLEQLRAQNGELRTEVESLKRQLKEQAEALERLQKAKVKP